MPDHESVTLLIYLKRIYLWIVKIIWLTFVCGQFTNLKSFWESGDRNIRNRYILVSPSSSHHLRCCNILQLRFNCKLFHWTTHLSRTYWQTNVSVTRLTNYSFNIFQFRETCFNERLFSFDLDKRTIALDDRTSKNLNKFPFLSKITGKRSCQLITKTTASETKARRQHTCTFPSRLLVGQFLSLTLRRNI